MKKSGYKAILVSYISMFILWTLIVLVGISLVFHVITFTDSKGNKVKNNWPIQYTRDFISYFELSGDVPAVSETGIQSLNNNLLWLQILDENGQEVYAHNIAGTQPKRYLPIDLLKLYEGKRDDEETVCIDTIQTRAGQWTYIIGFPINITKVTMYLNGDSFTGGKSMILILLSAAALLLLAGGGISGIWITRHMGKMTQAIGQIPYRLYEPIQDTGPFQDVYKSLNDMNSELLASDKELARNEILREEWISNITHDLKTPLTPIKGYAELLSDPDHSLSNESRIQYGQTILRNTEYAEKLVNDLKLTYQLKNHMLPIDRKSAGLTRFLKEIIIEILNYPEYADRAIIFDRASDDIIFSFDEMLLKRALNNLILNALIHNQEDTEIYISIEVNHNISIKIEDNGKGISPQEMDTLFKRYYRGTNSEAGTTGTGLGMAIAKQIIEIHDGTIYVESEPERGTCITIDFPYKN